METVSTSCQCWIGEAVTVSSMYNLLDALVNWIACPPPCTAKLLDKLSSKVQVDLGGTYLSIFKILNN